MTKSAASDLRRAITDAARETFKELRKLHSRETFYVFALYTNDEASSIVASANTEQGLSQRLKSYPGAGKEQAEELATALRWNAADWKYHNAGEERFETAQKILDDADKSAGKGIDDSEAEVEARLSLFVAALKVLDKEGFFGRGAAREQVTLLVMMGDQEPQSLLRCARELNPTKVYQKFSQPFLRSTAGKFKGIGSKKVYETTGVAVSKNGKLLACAGNTTSGWPCLYAFALPNEKEVLRLVLDETIGLNGVSVSPEGVAIFAGWTSLRSSTDGGVRCWEVRTRQVRWDAKCPGQRVVDISPDGTLIASGNMDGSVFLFGANDGKLNRIIKAHKGCVQNVRFSPSDNVLASSDEEKSIALWDLDSGKAVGKIADSGLGLAFSPDGRFLAVSSQHPGSKNQVSVWDVTTLKRVAELDVVAKSRFRVVSDSGADTDCKAGCLAFSRDGRTLAVARNWPGSVVFWDWKMGKELLWMNPDYEFLDGLAFLPDGKTIAVAGRSMSGPPLLLWDVAEAVG